MKLAGPDDPLEGIDAEQLPALLRDIFVAAAVRTTTGTSRPRDGERTAFFAVLVDPARVYGPG